MNRKKLFVTGLCCVLVAALGFGAFRYFQRNAPEYIEAERMKRAESLRAEYPYRDPDTSMASRLPFSEVYPEPDTWLKYHDALLLVEVSGDWEEADIRAYPTGDSADGSTTVELLYLPVQVTEVIGTREGTSVEDEIYLSFAPLVFTGRDMIQAGDRFALAVMAEPDETRKGKDVFLAGEFMFYLGGAQSIPMSMSSDAGPDALSGLTLVQFKARMEEIMEASGWND